MRQLFHSIFNYHSCKSNISNRDREKFSFQVSCNFTNGTEWIMKQQSCAYPFWIQIITFFYSNFFFIFFFTLMIVNILFFFFFYLKLKKNEKNFQHFIFYLRIMLLIKNNINNNNNGFSYFYMAHNRNK